MLHIVSNEYKGKQKRLIMLIHEQNLLVDKIVGDGVDGETGKRVYLEFAYDVAAMSHNSIDGNEEFVGYFLVRHSLNETHYYFPFAFGN